MQHDLYAILLKCDEKLERFRMTFEEFQKMSQRKESCNDLLVQAMIHDWPLIALIAATTKLYRWKFCWITWLTLSSDYIWKEKFKSIEELSKDVMKHCVDHDFIRTLDESLSVFYPKSSLKVFASFLRRSKTGNVNQMEPMLKHLIVKLGEEKYNLVVVKGKDEAMEFIIRCIIKHLQMNLKTVSLQLKCLEALCRSEISQFSRSTDFSLMLKVCKILERTNLSIDYELFSNSQSKSFIDGVNKVCENLIDGHQFETAIDLCNLLNLPKDDFVYKWWLHMWNHEDKNSKHFETEKYLAYVTKYDLSMDVMIKFLNAVTDKLEPCIKKFHIMKFILRNSWIDNPIELDALEYEIILLYIQFKFDGLADDLPLLMSEHFETVISKEKSIIHNSLFELKAIAKIEELTVSQKSLTDLKELELLDELIHNLLDAGDIVQVLRIQEMFGRAPEDLKLLVYIMSIAEGINSIYDITKEERKLISSYGLMSNKFNRLTLRVIRTSSSSEFYFGGSWHVL